MYVLKIGQTAFARSRNLQTLEHIKSQLKLDNKTAIYCYIIERETPTPTTHTKG